ncbi:phosphatase PAP2 family protein [Acidisoma cellulosilytica]|uniref:Acid phosphatase n=1 Tax=Acidisoma cellulosilyticum TaxID=2802395 RepID=A0A963Z4E8_9PROT|nr:phosphatase PAP2 family protein [Acidisoma cellulosilyticum]MCB8882429.1 phosphatase PAP2 family protein [Acidisoma cellulosilyticum]
MARAWLYWAVSGCVLVLSGPVASAHKAGTKDKSVTAYYIDPSQVDLDLLLAPPPVLGSAKESVDLATVVKAQADRTAEEAVDAEADHERSVFRFADVLGPQFTPENLPFATGFFARVYADEKQIVFQTKAHFNRPRPFMVDANLSPMVEPRKTPSYPSGHTTFAYVMAIILANMVPEKAGPIFDRAAEYGYNRVVAGAHFPTDIEAGRISGTVIDSVFFHDQAFLGDFYQARAEVRQALGLPSMGDMDR